MYLQMSDLKTNNVNNHLQWHFSFEKYSKHE